MFGNKCRKKPKKKIFAAKWPTELNEPNTRGRRPSQPMNWLRKMEKSERSNSTSDSIKRHSCSLWPEPWWKRKLQAICFLRFYFENIYLRSVCACASPSISIFPYFIPLFFLASFTCIGPAPKAGWCFILFCERNDSRLNVFFCANCEPFFAIVSGNEKRVVRYIQRLSQIGSQTKVVWVHSRLCIFLTSGRSFSFFAASVRLSSFGNRRRHRKRVLFLAHRHRERKKNWWEIHKRFASILLYMRMVSGSIYWYSDRVFVCSIALCALIVTSSMCYYVSEILPARCLLLTCLCIGRLYIPSFVVRANCKVCLFRLSIILLV